MNYSSASLHVGLLTPAYAGVTRPGSGIGVHFHHLARGLIEAGHTVTVVVATEQAKVLPGHIPGHVQVVTPSVPSIAWAAGRLHWQLHQWLCERTVLLAGSRAAARVQDVDIWETTSTGAPALNFLKRAGRSPVVTRVSTTASQLRNTNQGPKTWIGRVHEQWERRAVQASDSIITHSEGHRTVIAREFGLNPADIPVIPHGIPIPAEPTRTLLYVGRLETRKGVDLLLAALPSVLATRPRVRAVLVGSDANASWETRWRAEAPPAVRDQVVFSGVVDDDALAAHYRNADVLVAPSRYESFGLMFAEGMSWGLPVVALRAPGAIDLIQDGLTGMLTPPEDVPALASAIGRIADDAALRSRLGQASREHARRCYSVEALVEASTNFYRNVLRRSALA
jgi:glycosyltransferase involved in cell wall biosynthesis